MGTGEIESPNHVSIWVGTFPSKEALTIYAWEKLLEKYQDFVSQFEVDTGLSNFVPYSTGIYPGFTGIAQVPIEQLLREHVDPYCEPLVPLMLMAAYARDIVQANACIICEGMDYGQFEEDFQDRIASAPVRFLGTFETNVSTGDTDFQGAGIDCPFCGETHCFDFLPARAGVMICPCGAKGGVSDLRFVPAVMEALVELLELKAEMDGCGPMQVIQALSKRADLVVHQTGYRFEGQVLFGLWVGPAGR